MPASDASANMSRKYEFIYHLEEEDDGRWSASLDAIPWCSTFGDTKEDAIRELHDAASVAIQYYEIRGLDVPVDAPPLVVQR